MWLVWLWLVLLTVGLAVRIWMTVTDGLVCAERIARLSETVDQVNLDKRALWRELLVANDVREAKDAELKRSFDLLIHLQNVRIDEHFELVRGQRQDATRDLNELAVLLRTSLRGFEGHLAQHASRLTTLEHSRPELGPGA